VLQIHGGIQENGRRGGTGNVPGIVGLGRAAELAREEVQARAPYLNKLRDLLVAGPKERVSDVIYTGHPEKRLPGHTSFCIEGIEGEALLFKLSRQGIYANTPWSAPGTKHGRPEPGNDARLSRLSAGRKSAWALCPSAQGHLRSPFRGPWLRTTMLIH